MRGSTGNALAGAQTSVPGRRPNPNAYQLWPTRSAISCGWNVSAPSAACLIAPSARRPASPRRGGSASRSRSASLYTSMNDASSAYSQPSAFSARTASRICGPQALLGCAAAPDHRRLQRGVPARGLHRARRAAGSARPWPYRVTTYPGCQGMRVRATVVRLQHAPDRHASCCGPDGRSPPMAHACNGRTLRALCAAARRMRESASRPGSARRGRAGRALKTERGMMPCASGARPPCIVCVFPAPLCP